MQHTPTMKAESMRSYRKRLVAKGQHQLVVALPQETVAYLDEVKASQGLRSRNQALLQLIERGREATR